MLNGQGIRVGWQLKQAASQANTQPNTQPNTQAAKSLGLGSSPGCLRILGVIASTYFLRRGLVGQLGIARLN